jgi:hypothetical protein
LEENTAKRETWETSPRGPESEDGGKGGEAVKGQLSELSSKWLRGFLRVKTMVYLVGERVERVKVNKRRAQRSVRERLLGCSSMKPSMESTTYQILLATSVSQMPQRAQTPLQSFTAQWDGIF